MRAERWRNLAAFGTWIVVGLPEIARILTGRLGGTLAIAWTTAFAAFGVALTVCLVASLRGKNTAVAIALLATQSIAGLAMVALTGNGTSSATLVIVAAEVASMFPIPFASLWVAAQSLALIVVATHVIALIGGIALGGAFIGFQAFAVSTVALAARERIAREELARANAELHATRSLLAESSRVDERLRIARDLHDMLGHHLTALSLQLDVASRLAEDRSAEHVHQAHAITRLLLADVRDVVSRIRDSSRLDLAAAVRALAAAPAGALQIHLDMPAPLTVDDSARADAVLRSVQEIITNAARHAAAHNLWIRIARDTHGLTIHARDDGRGASSIAWGNGLRGMRERFEEHSGRLEVSAAAGRGFEVHGFLPASPIGP